MLKSKIRRLLILLAMCCLGAHLAGCGGDGGGGHHGGGGGGGGGPTPTIPWSTKQLGTIAEDVGYGIALDSSGNIYVTGSTEGDLDGNINAGLKDIFLVKYNSSGVRQWTRLLGTTADDVARGIAMDSSDEIYITGFTAGSLGGGQRRIE
ncbi:MAG: SBBP repeat-containing protein [candidate division NC10 bacterium]|nr:SBBP repeat-containing protein [candidate division NC10 bacterium]